MVAAVLVRRAVAALVLTALVGAAAACSPGYSAEPYLSATAGQVFPALLGDGIVGDVVTVELPARIYEVEVSRPQDTVDTTSADEAEVGAEAPDGLAFVAVAWELRPGRGDAIALGYGGPDVSPHLALTAGAETYDVGPLDQEGVSASWVAVPDGAGPIGVAVEFDGVTQVVEDTTDPHAAPTGASDLLYDESPPGLHDPECAEPPVDETASRYASSSCQLTVTDPIAYHEELGWAPAGRAWVVVRLAVDPVVVGWDDPGPGGAVVGYEVAPEDVTVTLDGTAPADVLTSGDDGQPAGLQDDGRWQGDAVFAVPADVDAAEVAFARPYTGRPEDPDEAAAEGTPAELAGVYEASVEVSFG